MVRNVDITWIDVGIWLTYFTIMLLLLAMYRWSRTDAYYKYFLWGFFLKVIAGVAYVLIYNYYYNDGDTFDYYRGSIVMSDTLASDPASYFRLLFSESDNLPADLWRFENWIRYSKGSEEWFMVKLISPIAFISFKSYLVMTLFLSAISFWGSWKLFLVLRDILPQRPGVGFAAIFLVPSALFWGGGIMKDTISLTAINLVIYCVYFSIFKRRFDTMLYAGAIFGSVIVFLLKGYIIIAFIPAVLFGINEMVKVEIKNKLIKGSLGFLLLIIVGLIVYIGPQFLQESSEKYNLESIESRVKGFHSWHTDMGGSSYNLGEVEYTTSGVISKIPAALNVTFFRPYLWEARNPVVMIAAFESTLVLIMCFVVLYKLGFKFMKYIREKPILMTFLIYSLIFGFIVGFTSYNFGALGRYKIPVFSLFAFILFYLNYHGNIYLESKKYVAEEK